MTVDAAIPKLDLDPYSPEFLADPYPRYAELRDAGQVVWLTPYQHYVVARHAETKVVLDDWEIFGSTRGFGLNDPEHDVPLVDAPEYERFTTNPRMCTEGMRRLLDAVRPDPPEHDPIRRMFMRMLAPNLVRSWREQIVEGADVLVAELVARERFDAAVELSEHFVLNVIGDIVGLPREGREHMLAYGNMAMNTSGPRNETYLDSIAQAADSIAWVETACKRDAVTGGGVAELVYDAVDAGDIPDEAMGEVFVRLFPTAAVDTTSSTIANAIHNLATNPDQWRLLCADPSLARNAFQETIRFTQAIHPLYRTTNHESRLAGHTIAAGTKMMLLLGSANRDPRVFENPDVFDIRRDASAQLGFGSGIHSCAGQSLARLEGEAVLGAPRRGPAARRRADAARAQHPAHLGEVARERDRALSAR
jgi:4-methoxybenzoate monooxygenase (O-demethylating)